MSIQEVILNNEKQGNETKNRTLVLSRIKELVDRYPEDVTELLHKTGVPISCVLPKEVIGGVLIKHVGENLELREALSKVILETENYANADGKGLAVAGGVMSALGSVLSGISRSQNYSSEANTELHREKERLEAKMEQDRQRQKRNTWLIAGTSILVLVAIVLVFKGSRSRVKPKTVVV